MPGTARINAIKINEFSKHIFWSYKPDAILPVSVIIKQVIGYGELSDLLLLTKKVPSSVISEVISSWKEKRRFRKRINFIQKVIF